MNFIKYVKPGQGNIYYGVSPSKKMFYEPIDHLDGFFLAKVMQKNSGAFFYPLIAGVYNTLNCGSPYPYRARKLFRRLAYREREKAELYDCIMDKLELEGDVILAQDVWCDKRYWEIFREVIKKIGVCEIVDRQREKGSNRGALRGMRFREFPKDLLGAYCEVFDNDYLKDVDSAALYVSAEVAEAVWLREKKNVGWKIGPEAEEMYDDLIEKFGIGIVRFRQPSDPLGNKKYSPYQGKECEERRVFFSDTKSSLEGKRWRYFMSNSFLENETQLLGFGQKVGIPINSVEEMIALGSR